LPESRARLPFCALHEIDPDQIGFDTRYRQNVRRELLSQRQDRGGLKYREMARLPGFAGVGMNSLGSMCRHERKAKK